MVIAADTVRITVRKEGYKFSPVATTRCDEIIATCSLILVMILGGWGIPSFRVLLYQ